MATIRKKVAIQKLIDGQGVKISPDSIDGVLSDEQIPSMSADKITVGIFNPFRIPQLPASRISSGVFPSDRLNLKLGDIPMLPARWINSGEFDLGRIPSLPAAKVESAESGGMRDIVMAFDVDVAGNLYLGAIKSGSSLRPSAASAAFGTTELSPSLAGSWRCKGYKASSDSITPRVTVWERVE